MVISLVGFKGGTGKSTTAIHLAAVLQEKGDTALVDLDATNQTCLDYSEDGNLSYPVFSADAFSSVDDYSFIVVDGYARPAADQLAELAKLSDLFILPTPCDAVSLRVLARSLEALEATGAPFKVLLTMPPPKPSTEAEKATRDLDHGSVPRFKTVIPRSVGFSHAARDTTVVWNVPGFSHLKKPFLKLRNEVLT